jgi:hypothetical protein
MVLRLFKPDALDRHGPRRTAVSFLASLLIHALLAFFLFSVATSSSEQAPESIPGSVVMTVSTQPVPSSAPQNVPKVAAAVPHAPVVRKPRVQALPRSAPPHPRILHELSHFAPTAPPNPTPAPASSLAPNPIPTQAVIAASPAPIPAEVPTAAPLTTVALSIKVPPTTAPLPKPSTIPSQAPRKPEPTAIPATAAPSLMAASPQPAATPGALTPVKLATQPRAHGTAASPGPKPIASAGPHGTSPIKTAALPHPVQVRTTPRPAPVRIARKHTSLSQRLNSLIPTAGPPVSPEPPKTYTYLGNFHPTPEPEPTPPPDVIAVTKFLFVENVAGQRWKQSYLGTAPEERYVKVYVRSVKRIGFIQWCTGWVLRAPMAGSQKWIIEPDESFVCQGHLQPFTPPSPLPSSGP